MGRRGGQTYDRPCSTPALTPFPEHGGALLGNTVGCMHNAYVRVACGVCASGLLRSRERFVHIAVLSSRREDFAAHALGSPVRLHSSPSGAERKDVTRRRCGAVHATRACAYRTWVQRMKTPLWRRREKRSLLRPYAIAAMEMVPITTITCHHASVESCERHSSCTSSPTACRSASLSPTSRGNSPPAAINSGTSSQTIG